MLGAFIQHARRYSLPLLGKLRKQPRGHSGDQRSVPDPAIQMALDISCEAWLLERDPATQGRIIAGAAEGE